MHLEWRHEDDRNLLDVKFLALNIHASAGIDNGKEDERKTE